MHGSIWTWRGDPDDLAARYKAMIAEVPPENMQLSACVRTADGIVVFDTCPSEEVFEAFSSSEAFRSLLARHGLEHPDSVADHPVVMAWARGRRVDT